MTRILLCLISLALAVLLLLNLRVYQPGGPRTVRAQLRYLEGALGKGAAEDMQQLFPEGYVFTWALYGLSSAQLASQFEHEDADRDHLLSETRRALAAIRSDAARATFDPRMDPPYGAFYASWSLYVLAEYVRAAGPARVPPPLLQEFTGSCDAFARSLATYGSPFLESYAGEVWPADTISGIAALGIYDAVVQPRYQTVIARWVADARVRLDPQFNVLTHAAEPITGRPSGGVRGESLALMSRLLVDADPQFAREQYTALRRHFLHDVAGIPGFREYPKGVDGKADIDTGPIIGGFSAPAVVVGAAAARVHGDPAVSKALLGGVELIGLPVQLGGRRVYAGGKLPVGDAFLAWARTSPTSVAEQQTWGHGSIWWFVPFHALSAGLAALLLWWGLQILRSLKRARQ